MIGEKIFATDGLDAGLEGALDGTIDAFLGQDYQPEDRFRRWNALPEAAFVAYRSAYMTAWTSLRKRRARAMEAVQ